MFSLTEKKYCKKQKINIIIVVVKKAAKYYIENKEVLKENGTNKYRNLLEEEKEVKREYGRSGYRNMTKNEKRS